MSDRDKFIRAICERPNEDMPRLVFADWLVEHGNNPQEKCPECDGTGQHRYMPDLGGEPNYSDSAACFDCSGSGWIPTGFHDSDLAQEIRYGIEHPKNFYSCQSDASVGLLCQRSHPCNLCWELRQRGMPWAMLCERDYKMCRGFLEHIECSTAKFLRYAAKLFATMPVESVRLADREPGQFMNTGRWYYCEHTLDTTYARHTMPVEILRLAIGRTVRDVGPGTLSKDWDTSELADAAISVACVAYGRRNSGLPNV